MTFIVSNRKQHRKISKVLQQGITEMDIAEIFPNLAAWKAKWKAMESQWKGGAKIWNGQLINYVI